MFYENQPANLRENYKKMLAMIGNMTQLFSESDCPYLPYRAHENIFCKFLNAENLARLDCSADAKKGRLGIGLKTWVGRDDQKIAEFGRLRELFSGLSGLELVKTISEYRNERIRITKNLYGIDTLIYHIVKRIPGAMQIFEHPYDFIDIDNISLLKNRGNVNNTYFTDGRNTYHFSTSKNTLYMVFTEMELLDAFEVEILDDPYRVSMQLMYGKDIVEANKAMAEISDIRRSSKLPRLCLRLYSTQANGSRFVPMKSGINQWNAGGRSRNPNELYIPYPAKDRKTSLGFFPSRGTIFELTLPDGSIVSAKVCQDDGKAIMSNPNKVLGEWLLRNVFELPERTIVTYKMLQKFDVDCVIFTKHGELKYSVDFSKAGTYEEFYGELYENEE